MPELRENLARALAQLHVAAWRFAGGQRFYGFEILRRGEESLHHDAPVLAPLIDIGQPCLHAIHGPAAKLFPGGVLSKYAFGAQADQLLAVDLDQIPGRSPPLLDCQRSEHEIGNIAPWPPLAHKLPIKPDPLAAVAQKAVALV